VARRKLSDSIVEDFLRRIGNGELQAGAAVPAESALSATYGVGRSVTREALRGLAAKGFLEVRQGSATVVAPRHRWQVLDPDFLAVNSGDEFFAQLQEARELIEPQLAALAAERADAEVIATLQELTRQLADAGTNRSEHARIDIRFHEVIATATGNPVLASLHASITSLGLRTREASVDVPGAVDRAVFWHRHILAAIESGDASSADAAMRMHLRQVRDELEQLDAVTTTVEAEP
jgi:DNA-binding FadR family transcriptional regulator